ncbi:3-carboxy-cis,cis-muconate cycloisomerase [Pseudomonas aeruginosa]|nr:3-carboxy-cis,cis-muconate cycloisomerase [Pseudomonas aeruginosa]
MSDVPANQLFDAYFMAAPMRAVFSDRGRLQGMLDFEAALARAEARTGVVPATGRQVAAGDAEAERYVHLGATSQDAMDSGLVLQLRRALALLEQDLQRLAEVLADQAERHADTPLAGRTWLQHATPVTLGMKLAGLLGALTRHRQRLRELRPRLLVLQFGGASGTLAALGEQALPVAPGLVSTLFAAMPQEHERSLGLWHAEWETLPELCCLVAGALQQAIGLLEGLEVDAQRMRRNLGLTHGLVLAEAVSIALARRIGREAAHHLVEQCCRRAVEQRRELRAVLGEEARVSAELSGDELDRLLDPAHYLGQARAWVERALAEHHALGFEPHPA